MTVIFKLFLISIFITSQILSQTPIYYSGYPIIVDSMRIPYSGASVPLITDLDNDKQKEVVFSLVGSSTSYMLYVIKSNGEIQDGFPKEYNTSIRNLASGDVNGDGYIDIAVRFVNSIDVIDRFGNSLSGFPIPYDDGDNSPTKIISLYDLNSDGKLEIIVNQLKEICVFNFNGGIRNGWPQRIVGQARMNPAIGDINNDGDAEIIFATYKQLSAYPWTDSATLRIYRSDGSAFSDAWPSYYDSLYYNWGASPSLVLNKSNIDSTYILMASSSPSDNTGFKRNRITKYNIDGEVLNQNFQSTLNTLGTLVIGDVNKDGNPEYATGGQGFPYLTLYNTNLEKINGWPQEGVGEQYATPIIGKFTNDNFLNIVDNNWSAYNPNGFGNIFGYNYDGSPLSWSPLRPIGLVEAISAGDLNNDGSVELIAISTLTGNECYLHIWTIPGIPYTNEDFPWPQYGHDRYRTNQYGFIPPDEPVGIYPTSTNVPDKFSLYQNYPNPFNPATTIKFDIRTVAFTKLTVFDILGREIQILVNEELKTGSYSLVFDGSKYNSGVYFYRLASGDFTETKRMLLIK